jgi:Family of unknown function (DUF6493)
MSLDPEELKAAFVAADVRQVRELLRGATQAERRACAESLERYLRAVIDTLEYRIPELRPTGGMFRGLSEADQTRLERRWRQYSAAFVALRLGLADSLEAATWAHHSVTATISPWEDDFDEIVNVLADRRPSWLAELAGRWLETGAGQEPWHLARRLVRLGAIARPAIPQYATRMPAALYREGWVAAGRARAEWRPDARRGLLHHPLDGLLADPGLLDDEVWRLFEVPGAARELARCDGTWEEALATLAERGLLDRGRLLDACLGAFFLDFPAGQLGWYARFHNRMAPTLDEVTARAGRYLALLGTNSGHGVPLAQRACGRLLAAGRLPLADFLIASPPLLLFPQKGVALRQLRLLGQVAGEPSLRAPALATAAGAFGHARLDVQEAALDLIGELGVPEGAEAAVIAGHAAYLSPALAGKAAALGLLAAPDAPPAAPSPAPAPPGDLPPLEDPAELVRLLTQLMEDAPDPLAVERVMAGAVRLATVPEPDRRRLGAPLVKRAEELVGGYIRRPHALSEWIARLALAWAAVPCAPSNWVNIAKIVRNIHAARALEALSLIEHGPAGAELLAEPTAADGSVHPDALLARLATWRGAPLLRYDTEVALLRLPPADPSFWPAWADVHPASAREARQAHQAGQAELAFEPVAGTTNGRSTRSSSAHVLARIAGGGPPGAAGESGCWQMLLDVPAQAFDLHFESPNGGVYMGGSMSPVVASWPLLCPWQPELAAAHLLWPLSHCLAPGRDRAGPGAAAVTGLTRSSAPLGPVRHLALLTGLGSAEASVRLAAADAWAQAALAGRLNPDLAADALVPGVTAGAIKLTRVADGLRHASPEPASARMIASTVFAAADRLVPAGSPNLHLLLELTREVGAAIALPEPPESIVALAAGNGPARLTATARQLVKP